MKKFAVLLLCGVIMATSLPLGNQLPIADAATDEELSAIDPVLISAPAASDVSIMPIKGGGYMGGGSSLEEPAEEALEKAILTVKGKITIPEEYSEFDYYFNGSNSYSGTNWNLTWRNPDNSNYIQVNVDQNDHILSYSEYDMAQENNGIPVYLKSELTDTALKFIKKIAPEIDTKLELVSSNYEGVYNGTYAYTFERKENGVSFPDNSVIVTVDSITGKVKSASVGWLYDVQVPSPDASITKDEAADIIGKNLKMKLVYRMNYYRFYDSSIRAYDYEKKAFLVYEPDQPYISIDAKTGEVYLTRSVWTEVDRNGSMEKGDAVADESVSGAKSISASLTQKEIEKINELEKLITKDKAIELVTGNQYLHIDENLLAYDASLTKQYSYDKNNSDMDYVWNITLSDPRPVDYETKTDSYRAYANATVDAKTGKILSFNASLESHYNEETGTWEPAAISYDKEEGKVVLEKFLKSEANSRFKKTKLVSTSDDYVIYYKEDNTPVYGGYYYQYNRFNEGVEFTYNSISGAVDGVTGKIYSFYMNWDDDMVFESPRGAMTPEEAFEAYISKDGYHQVYEINTVNLYDPDYKGEEKYYDYSGAYSVEYEIRLAYRPDVIPNYISPFTGDQMNYDGSVYEEAEPYAYTDVENIAGNRDILLLADMNIGFEGGYFYPSKDITVSELTGLLDKINYGYWYGTEETEEPLQDVPITREEIAYDFIKRLGLEKVAGLQGIYSTGYNDQTSIGTKYLGAVALAKGLGLMEADVSNSFNPQANVTRLEAVRLIMDFIKVQKQGIY